MKFCGLTRFEDAREAASLGASFVGVVFAGGARAVTAAQARQLFDGVAATARRVGVFGADALQRAPQTVEEVSIDVMQLHGDPRAADVIRMRRSFGGHIWAVARLEGAGLPAWVDELFREADAVLLDARVAGMLGGSGVALPWGEVATALDGIRDRTPVVLAGGLTPENVAEAIRLVAPDVVDVSSGVESAPGIKDHGRMRAFMRAAKEHAE